MEQSTTNSEGRFSIPVNGGGTITVVYEKSGYITTHRQVNAPWNDIAIAETIAMTADDAMASQQYILTAILQQ